MLLLLSVGQEVLAGEPEKFEFSEVLMGVPLKISVYVDDEALANKGATAAFERVKELDQLLSDYKIDSELNQLALERPYNVPHPVSTDLFHVLKISEKVSEESAGAFDVSVGPLVKLWRKARRQKELPDTIELNERKKSVDYRLIQLNEDGQKVTLSHPGMRLDLGGIAKGYAADAALKELKKQGLNCAILDFGGDVVVGDPPPGKEYWTIAVAPLKNDAGAEKFQFIDLKNGSVATSGDAYQYVELDGVRYSHIVNPKTGLGLTERSSVTVIAPNGTLADAWASAVSVLGPERGVETINRDKNLATFIITETETIASENWKEYLHSEATP
ncbi:MAG: FAD:protein FMN transferase [Planctomycetaceae bacterium]